jgi:GT2 family glycosyltransferase
LFILNPDTQVLPSSVKKLTRFLDEHKKCAIVAPKQVNEKGKTIHQIGNGELTPLRAIFALSFLNKVFPNNPFSRAYWRKDKINNDPVQVDTVAGSAFIIRKTVFEKVGGFDENFFLYFEEQDLCKRVKELRLNIYINPKAQVIHYWQPGKPNTTLSKKIFANSRFYYFKKHYGLFKALLVECFARFSKTSLIFLFIFCIGAFLRFL